MRRIAANLCKCSIFGKGFMFELIPSSIVEIYEIYTSLIFANYLKLFDGLLGVFGRQGFLVRNRILRVLKSRDLE